MKYMCLPARFKIWGIKESSGEQFKFWIQGIKKSITAPDLFQTFYVFSGKLSHTLPHIDFKELV